MARRIKSNGGEGTRDITEKEARRESVHVPNDMTPKDNELAPEWKSEKTTPTDEATGTIHPEDGKSGHMSEIEDGEIGRVGPIGKDEIAKAYETFEKYKSGKANLEKRVVENERWWRLRHWDIVAGKENNKEDPRPVSAWLFNSLANKHADAMDNYPTVNVLPREKNDVEDARLLSEIMPVLLERNNFRKIYSDAWWYKLKQGTAVYGVYWNNAIDNGVGDIAIKRVDLLNIFWEPGIANIQDSRNVFTVELVDNDVLEERYPFLAGKTGTDIYKVEEYVTDDNIDNSEKTAVIDWYYKAQIGSKQVLHYCKFACGEVIYASENDPELAETGFYEHGEYPFVFDVMFPMEGSPAGFGYIDVMKDPQMYIDKMNQIIAKNALMAGKKRLIVKGETGINEDELTNYAKDVIHAEGNLDDDHFRWFETPALPSHVLTYMQWRVDELKETSGNRDFSQGTTTAGVTAASAIAALQEAGSKLSRDMISTSYNAYEQMNHLVLELIRQFYEETRFFRIVGEQGMDEFVKYDNRRIRETLISEEMGEEGGFRKPIFDIKISAQKQSPFSRISQNELAKELFGMGLFNPQMADQALVVLDMMEFEGKDALVQKISQNQQMLQMIQQLQAQNAQLMQTLDLQNAAMGQPSDLMGAAAQEGQFAPPDAVSARPGRASDDRSSRFNEHGESGQAAKARTRVAQSGTPRA